MKVAVVGPESSGTRLMTRIMTEAGAEALHRSFPYGKKANGDRRWPEADVVEFGPDAVVWMSRDWWATAPSQIRAEHVEDIHEAWINIAEATYRVILLCKENDYPFYIVNYESLIQRPAPVVRNITSTLGLKMPDIEHIVDGNSKYLGGL